MFTKEQKQQFFNEAIGGVIAQGGGAWSRNWDMCVYHDHETGDHCGIGHILANRGLITPEIEGIGLGVLRDTINDADFEFENLDKGDVQLLGVMSLVGMTRWPDLEFMRELQGVHDGAFVQHRIGVPIFDMEDFKRKARHFAIDHDLNAEVVV